MATERDNVYRIPTLLQLYPCFLSGNIVSILVTQAIDINKVLKFLCYLFYFDWKLNKFTKLKYHIIKFTNS